MLTEPTIQLDDRTHTHVRRASWSSRHAHLLWAIVIIAVLGLVVARHIDWHMPGSMYGTDDSIGAYDMDCNVAGINVHGELLTYGYSSDDDNIDNDVTASEDVVAQIDAANDDDSIKAILVEIDSPGGEPVAGEEISNALHASSKPTVAVIRQTGASAAYWAATGASYIFGSANSDIGSIGATASYSEAVDPTKKYIDLSSGKYKDTGNPDRPISDDEKSLILRDVNIVRDNFIKAVADHRHLAVASVQAIADGSTVLGARAHELGLIDAIGSWDDATTYLDGQIGEKASVCW